MYLNHPQTIFLPSLEKLSSMKLAPDAKNVGDIWVRALKAKC